MGSMFHPMKILKTGSSKPQLDFKHWAFSMWICVTQLILYKYESEVR